MAQLAEISNVIKEVSLYPSLAPMASNFITDEFINSFNHIRDGNKNGQHQKVFKSNMEYIYNRQVLIYNTGIKKSIISSEKLFNTPKPSVFVLFLLEYHIHVMKTLRTNNHINIFDKGNLIEGTINKHYPLATFVLKGQGEEYPCHL